jgi:hypothetical protein
MAIIMQTSSLIIYLIILMTASVTGKAVFAQERIRIATAGGLSIVPVWVMQDQRIIEKARRGCRDCPNLLQSGGHSSNALGRSRSHRQLGRYAGDVRLAGADVTMIMSTHAHLSVGCHGG